MTLTFKSAAETAIRGARALLVCLPLLGFALAGQAQAQPQGGNGPAVTPQATCFQPDISFTCSPDGKVEVILKGTAGSAAPDSVTIITTTPGISISPGNFTPISSGPTKVTLNGAKAGDRISLQIEGTRMGGGSFAGADLCCAQTVDIDVPKDVCTKPPKFTIAKTCEACEAGKDCKCKITVTSTDKTGVFPGNLTITEALTQSGGAPIQITATSSPQPWACTPATPNAGPLSCAISGTALAANQNTSVINVTIKVPADAKDAKNCASLPGDVAADPKQNKACVDIKVTEDPPKLVDVSLKKKFVKGASDAAGTFSLDVKNEGSALATPNIIKIADPIPTGVTITGLAGTSATTWNCSNTFPLVGPSTLNCTYTGPMPVAAGATLPTLGLAATLAPAGPGSPETGLYQNCATVGLTANAQPVTETSTANNKACTVTNTINTVGCELGSASCPRPQAVCKQDVLIIVDASASILGGAGTVNAAIKSFLNPMIGKGGNVYAASFSDKSKWTELTGGAWVPITGTVPTGITVPSSSLTNWDDALQRGLGIVNAHAPKPLVLFITDGDPTAYNDDTTSNQVSANSPPMPLLAASQAVPWINQIRAAGSPVIAVGFGPQVSAGYLDAAFSGPSSDPSNIDFENSSVIKAPSISNLNSVMSTLGNQMCGTLSLNKSGGGYQSHELPDGGTVAVNDTFTFDLKLTNNAATPLTGVTGIVVQDQVPATLSGLNVVSSTPGTTGSFSGQTLSWSIPTLAARTSATIKFSGKWVKTYSAVAYETSINYAQVTAAVGYNATALNSMNPTAGPVVEVDESAASFGENIYKNIVYPDPCLGATKPAWCYGTVTKSRLGAGVEDGNCTPGHTCKYAINVALNSPPIPAGSTVQVKDVLTLNGTAVSWPVTVPTTICSGTTPTNTGSFNCAHTGLTSFGGNVEVSIPAGQTGNLNNCVSVVISNPSAGAPFPLTLGPSCAPVTLSAPSAKINQGGGGDYAATAAAIATGIIIPRIITGRPDPVACPPGTQRNARGECIRTQVSCQPGQVLNAAGLCIAQTSECQPGTQRNPATGQCVKVDRPPPPACDSASAYRQGDACVCRYKDAQHINANACACPEGTRLRREVGACVPNKQETVCPQGQRFNGRECVRIDTPLACDRSSTVRRGDECLCRFDGMHKTSELSCACPAGTALIGGRCAVPPPKCGPGEVLRRGECVDITPRCDPPKIMRNGHCVLPPPKCDPPQVPRNGRCVDLAPRCDPPQVFNPAVGRCVDPRPKCGPGQVLQGRTCVEITPKCRPPSVMQNGRCVMPRTECPPPSVYVPPLGRCMVPPRRVEPRREPAIDSPVRPGRAIPGGLSIPGLR